MTSGFIFSAKTHVNCVFGLVPCSRFGHHVSGWRLTENPGLAGPDIDWLIGDFSRAEEGKFDMFFVGDAHGDQRLTGCRPTMARGLSR